MSNPLKPLLKLNKEIGSVEKALAGQQRRLKELLAKRETFLVQYIKKQHLFEGVVWRFDVEHRNRLYAEGGMEQIHELCSGMLYLSFGGGVLHLTINQICFNTLADLVSFVKAWNIKVRGNVEDLEGIKAECSRKAKELNAMESLILKGQHG